MISFKACVFWELSVQPCYKTINSIFIKEWFYGATDQKSKQMFF